MKKLILTTTLILTMGLCAFAQQSDGALRRSGLLSNRDATTPVFPQGWGNEDDANANNTPLGTGIAVLTAFGAAYLMGKRRREE